MNELLILGFTFIFGITVGVFLMAIVIAASKGE